MKTKKRLQRTAITCLSLLVLEGALFTEGKISEREGNQRKIQEESFQQTQRDLLAVDRYLQSKENPEAFDGLYSLGWSPESAVPERYLDFVKNYQPSRE